MAIRSVPSIRLLAALLSAASLAACANPPGDQDHGQHYPARSAPATTVPDPSGASSAGSSMMGGAMKQGHPGCGMMGGREARPGTHMDKEAMCAMYRSMRDAPTEQERQALMDRNMQDMPPEMRQRHMEMMRQQCQ
jgi:hypothetical protein